MAVERWTDEMVDELASSVTELRTSITELRDTVDGLKITAQALLQLAAQSQRDMEIMQQRQTESDERFNVLLEKLRYLNRRNDKPENGESN
jgi:prefoldin subunit 5